MEGEGNKILEKKWEENLPIRGGVQEFIVKSNLSTTSAGGRKRRKKSSEREW